MIWYAWMLLGAGTVVALFLLFLACLAVDECRERQQARLQRIGAAQRQAEAEMQQVVQQTISQMFQAVRGGQ